MTPRGAAAMGGGLGLRSGELSPLISEWPGWVREVYEERAAILEFDARMVRSRAEAAAEDLVRDRYRRGVL